MKILVFGKTGQVALELQKFAGVTALARSDADLADPAACAQVIAKSDADVVINAAAFTAVDLAEQQEALAFVVNGETPAAMAVACAKRSIPFLHISTDYVFDGTGDQPRTPTDQTAPINIYGRSKLAGEIGIASAAGDYAILRTSWVFSAHGANFVKTMLRLAETRDALSVVDDQIGGPTPAASIAAALINMAKAFHAGRGINGVYHFSGKPDISWKGFAAEIFVQSGHDIRVTGISTAQYPTPAARPLNSRLDCRDLETVFGIKQPNWRTGLRDVLTELKEAT